MLVAVGTCVAPALVWADDETTYTVELESQLLSESLKSFADQTGLQVVFFSEVTNGLQAVALNGNYTADVALDTLLDDSGLTYEYINDKAVTIKSVGSVATEDLSSGKSQPASSPVLMAQNQTSVMKSQRRETSQQSNSDEGNRAATLEEIIVTGTHIRGVDNVGATSITFTREELDKTGFSTLEEVFESLPQNLDEINIDGAAADGASSIAGTNSQLASGVSLRGLGPSSTLVLLNGKRRPASVRGRVVDVSAIPLSMVERMEVVTGGHSAVYGSDAVAGVVNVVTRTEFDGAESQVYYGEASAGAERLNFSQTFGRDLDQGGFVLGYDYRRDKALDATEAGFLKVPSPAGVTPIPGLFRIRVPSEQHVGLFAGRYELSDEVELYTDLQFSSDKNEGGQAFNFLGLFDTGGLFITDSNQYSAVGGVHLDVGDDWQVDVSGLYGVADNTTANTSFLEPAGTITSLEAEPESLSAEETGLISFSAIADGPLGRFGRVAVSGAIGVDFRNESFRRVRTDLLTDIAETREDLDRNIWSIFGEVHLPLIKRNEHRLEVSLAGRYEEYSDFGSTFNPQVGVEWQPIGGLVFRGSYSEAFRAPDLFTLGFGSSVVVNTRDDPLAPGTTASVFSETGGNPDLQPEKADTYTLGINWHPSDRSKLSLSYFNIRYRGRIDIPAILSGATALVDEALFPDLINRNPTAAQLDALLTRAIRLNNQSGVAFDPEVDDPFVTFPNIVIFDNRRNNIGLEAVDGLDLQALVVLETNSGDWSFGLNGTYYLDFTRNITVTSPPIDQFNRPGRPVDLKLRGHVGWSRSAWSINAFVDYTDSYDDTIAATPTTIDSWTTVDLNLRFRTSEVIDNGFLTGVNATLGVSNVFDEGPPVFLNNTLGLGYDGANSSPVGRFVSFRLSKRW